MMNLDYSPYIWPLLLATIICLTLAYRIWRRGPGKGIIPFVALQFSLILWILPNTVQLLMPDLESKIFFRSIAYIGISGAPLSWLLFTLEYTDRGQWITRRRMLLLLIEPVFTVLASATNSIHNLFISKTVLVPFDGFSALGEEFGPLFWIHVVYSYLMLVGVTGLLIITYRRGSRLYRAQISILLAGAMVPWIANGLFISGLVKSPTDLTPLAFTVNGIAMAIGISRFRLLDILPVAREKIVDNMLDGVIVLDDQNRIVDINRAALAIIKPMQPEGIVGAKAEAALGMLGSSISQMSLATETRTEIAVGEEPNRRYFAVQLSPLVDRNQSITAKVIVMHEITQAKQASQQIEQQNAVLRQTNEELGLARKQAEDANKLKSQFLANMSHELRTPLNAIIGYAQILSSGMLGELPPRVLEFQERTLLNAKDLLKLINDLLDISKIEAQRMELLLKPFNVHTLLREIEVQNRVLAENKKLRFCLNIDRLMPETVIGDEVRVKQILTNLLANAIKFTDVGSIELRAEKSSTSTWRIVVADTGVGIPPHLHEVIFDEFRQAEASVNNQLGGTGLGLSIVRRLVMMMGGSINLRSQVGKGSEFTVILPIEVHMSSAPQRG